MNGDSEIPDKWGQAVNRETVRQLADET